jgi:predicted alpha/beta-hydrolase family hydrolase
LPAAEGGRRVEELQMRSRNLRIRVSAKIGSVGARLVRSADADCLLVLAHGAGAGMDHPFMETLVSALANRRVATLRYQFPYMEAGTRAISPRAQLRDTVRAAVEVGRREAGELVLIAGGKSMGGRMTSMAASEESLAGVEGIIFVGFPLHAAGKPGVERAEHLRDVELPMLFLQGTRDKLADLELLAPIVRNLGRRARIARIEGGDHSFHVLKRSGRTDDEAMDELVTGIRHFCDEVAAGG